MEKYCHPFICIVKQAHDRLVEGGPSVTAEDLQCIFVEGMQKTGAGPRH